MKNPVKNDEKSRQEVRLVQTYPLRKMKKKKKKLRPVCFSLPLCGFPFSKRLLTFLRHLEHFEKLLKAFVITCITSSMTNGLVTKDA